MRFPCETIVRSFLSAYRNELIQTLSKKNWTQQRIADALMLTQAAVSNYLKNYSEKGDKVDETLVPIVDDLVERTIALLEEENMKVSDIMDVVCRSCKMARRPRGIFCLRHKEEIPALQTEACDICTKYLNPTLVDRGNEESDILHELLASYNSIREDEKFASLIPEVQSNMIMGFVDPAKADFSDFAGFPSRIFKMDGKATVMGQPRFGASKHMAKIVSIIRKKFAHLRSALCIVFNSKIDAALTKANFATLKLEDERDQATLEKELVAIDAPTLDVLIFAGSVGMEPLTYIVGRSSADVVDKLEKILQLL